MTAAASPSMDRLYRIQRVRRPDNLPPYAVPPAWLASRAAQAATARPKAFLTRRRIAAGGDSTEPDVVAMAVRNSSPGEGTPALRLRVQIKGADHAVDTRTRTTDAGTRRPAARTQGTRRRKHPRGGHASVGTVATTYWTCFDGQATVFIGVDHASTKCIGSLSAKRGTIFRALNPLRQSVREGFGGCAAGVAAILMVRHDCSCVYICDDFQGDLCILCVEFSLSFVSDPEGRDCAERIIRTLQEQILWIRRITKVEDPHLALLDCRDRYNRAWLIERNGYQRPAAQHQRLLNRRLQAA